MVYIICVHTYTYIPLHIRNWSHPKPTIYNVTSSKFIVSGCVIRFIRMLEQIGDGRFSSVSETNSDLDLVE